MRILVCIASYGTKNDVYLNRIIEEYENMSFYVDIIVTSDRLKNLNERGQNIVGLPTKNPHSLPFVHKKILAENVDKYDLFIYSEDDILITEHNIKSFLENTKRLPEDSISGFLLYEEDAYGNRYCPDAETRFHWVLNSVEEHEGELFAKFGNDHSASYILDKKQLKKAIESGGYLVPPHEGDYDLECSAATDPYTQCGFRRLICISRLFDSMLHHLPNRYVGIKGIPIDEMQKQIECLKNMYQKNIKCNPLFSAKKNIDVRYWDKYFYENVDPSFITHLKGPNKKVLSVGSGHGALEAEVKRLGHQVIAIPIDEVIGESLKYRGIDIAEANFEKAFFKLNNYKFNCIILSNILQHIENIDSILKQLVMLLDSTGSIIVKIPNFNFFKWKSKRPDSFNKSKLNCVEIKYLKYWFKKENFKVAITPQGTEKVNCFFKLAGPIMSSKLARYFILVAVK